MSDAIDEPVCVTCVLITPGAKILEIIFVSGYQAHELLYSDRCYQ